MGTSIEEVHAGKPSALANALFTPVQQRVLGLLFGQPNRRFQSAELIRLANSGTGAAHRVLRRLATCGLVLVEQSGRQKFYQANTLAPVHKELVGLIQKTAGLADPLRKALAPFVQDIHFAFVFGSVAAGRDRADSDIDLMIVAESVDYAMLYEALMPAEQALGRLVNPNLITLAEWRRKKAQQDSFIARITKRPCLFLVGTDNESETAR